MNVIGIFCEDIREEISGLHTIVGIMPDGINLPAPPESGSGQKALIPKIGIYIRLSFSTEETPPESIVASVRLPGSGTPLPLGEMPKVDLNRAFADANAKKAPILGVIFKAIISPLRIEGTGPSTLHVSVDGKDHLCGILNIQFEGKII